MFRGNNEINMDAKGRMAIPARYRDELASMCEGHLVVTIDTQERCLLIYPLPKWEEVEEQVAALPSLNPASRRFQRLLIGHARELELDGSGRILIPPELRKHAQMDKKVMLVGQRHRFELWSGELWEAKCEDMLADSADELAMSDEMLTLSL
ncbi:division/cell wall cluster transcriptional repressor MraZ [Porticoccaceae bacterium LTM1]|nr:division/cell wall cluster transcriptional repressor MraZ [Porticoccaceae bacterium LTM1]